MIEKIIKDYLQTNIPDIPILLERPANSPTTFVLLEKTGSGRENYINYATMAIQCYAPSLYEAAQLNETVKSYMFDIIELNAISKSQLNSDYNFTDPTTKEYRYQAVFDLTYYD